MSITETLLDMIDSTAEKTTYSLTTAEIVELIEKVNNGYVIDELFADDGGLKAKNKKSLRLIQVLHKTETFNYCTFIVQMLQ